MAVYERSYKQFTDKLTPEWSRFLIIPRHAYHHIFKSKLFTAFFVLCFIPLLVEAILIYLHHNITALTIINAKVRDLVPIDGSFFQTFVSIQAGLAFFIALLIGPPQVSRDLRNNALPLYLCRPFSRAEYVLGKMSVMFILLSVVTWVPQLLLFLFQGSLGGAAWLKENLWIAGAIFIGSLVWILLLALLSQAISAVVKWRVVASAVLLGIFFIPSVFAQIINALFMTRWASLISLDALMRNIMAGLFRTFVPWTGPVVDLANGNVQQVIINEPPLWCSWAALFVVCAVCLGVLSQRVKAYEVVK